MAKLLIDNIYVNNFIALLNYRPLCIITLNRVEEWKRVSHFSATLRNSLSNLNYILYTYTKSIPSIRLVTILGEYFIC